MRMIQITNLEELKQVLRDRFPALNQDERKIVIKRFKRGCYDEKNK